MEQLTVQLQNAAYPVYIGDGLLSQAGTLLRSASNVARWAVVADENAARLYGDTVLDSLHAAGLDAALRILAQNRRLPVLLVDCGLDEAGRRAVSLLAGDNVKLVAPEELASLYTEK